MAFAGIPAELAVHPRLSKHFETTLEIMAVRLVSSDIVPINEPFRLRDGAKDDALDRVGVGKEMVGFEGPGFLRFLRASNVSNIPASPRFFDEGAKSSLDSEGPSSSGVMMNRGTSVSSTSSGSLYFCSERGKAYTWSFGRGSSVATGGVRRLHFGVAVAAPDDAKSNN